MYFRILYVSINELWIFLIHFDSNNEGLNNKTAAIYSMGCHFTF